MVKWAPCSCRELKVLLVPVHPSLTHIYWSRLWSDEDQDGHDDACDDHDNDGQQCNVHTVAFEKLNYDVSSILSKNRNFSDGKSLLKYDRDGDGCDDNVIL